MKNGPTIDVRTANQEASEAASARRAIEGMSDEEIMKMFMSFRRDKEKKEEVGKKITEKLQERGFNDINIEELDPNQKGINMHFVATADERRFHIKTAALQNSSFSSRFNEIFAYKVLENLKYGPKESSAIIDLDRDSTEMDRNSGLMVITESLSNINEAKPNKAVHFQDTRRRNGVSTMKEPTARHKEDVHRCCISIIIGLLDLHDVQSNWANMGIKTTNKDGEEKSKPFIIDFLLSGSISLVNESELITNFASNRSFQDRSYFTFNSTPNVRKEALDKLYGEDASKFREAITQAANNIKDRFGNSMRDRNMTSLDELGSSWIRNSQEFYDQTYEPLAAIVADTPPPPPIISSASRGAEALSGQTNAQEKNM
jgi:hypothetical protein